MLERHIWNLTLLTCCFLISRPILFNSFFLQRFGPCRVCTSLAGSSVVCFPFLPFSFFWQFFRIFHFLSVFFHVVHVFWSFSFLFHLCISHSSPFSIRVWALVGVFSPPCGLQKPIFHNKEESKIEQVEGAVFPFSVFRFFPSRFFFLSLFFRFLISLFFELFSFSYHFSFIFQFFHDHFLSCLSFLLYLFCFWSMFLV